MRQKITWLLVLAALILAALVGLGYGYFRWIRFEEIDEMVLKGQAVAGPESSQTESLLALLESSSVSLRDKNRAIWALGELGDPSALPHLRDLDTFEECDHATRICVYELRKAIGKLEERGGGRD